MFPQADTEFPPDVGSLWDRNVHPILEMKTPSEGLNPGSGAPGQGCPQGWAPPSFLS